MSESYVTHEQIREATERFLHSSREGPWKCFHCGEICVTEQDAKLHFGSDENDQPGCIEKINPGGERGILESLRRLEREYEKLMIDLSNETTQAHNQMRAMQGRHDEALRRAEELGFERGLAAARAQGWHPA